ncbi:ABC transporter substrate-binding protein [Thioclava sp. BHET1]|nr:ABC transporter substrate-binding protein [Thioclava sp. BHET1]
MKFLLSVLLSGCVALAAQSAAAQEPVKLEIGYMPILPVSQLFVTLEDGGMKQAGISPDLVQFQNGPAMVQALLAGQLDVAYLGIGPAMVARAKGADIKVVASDIVEQISFIALGDLAPYFKTDPKTAFARFAKDHGRKAVITTFPVGSVPETVLQYWLRKELGVDPSEVEIVYQGTAQAQQALLTGAVDGGALLEPIVSTVLNRNKKAVVVASGGEMFPHQPGAVLAVREKTIKAHPEAISDLVAAHLKATELLRTDPEKATPMVAKYVGGGRLPVAIVTAALKRSANTFVADPNAIVDGTREMQDFQADLGTLKTKVDLKQLFDLTIYDNKLTQK